MIQSKSPGGADLNVGRPSPETSRGIAVLTRISGILAALSVLGLVVYFGAAVFVMTSEIYKGDVFPADYIAFWASGQLALDGRAIEAFDTATITTAVTIPAEYDPKQYYWMYPPTWAAVTTPLGALPFWVAWPLFSAATVVLYITAIGRWAGRLPGEQNLLLAAPVVVLGAMNGNTGLLLAGLLILALSAMERERWVAAGLLIAAMTVKPTLGVLIPVALIAGGYWRVVLWATVGTIVFALLAAIPFGFEYWARFFAEILIAADRLAEGGIPTEVMVTWYGFGRALGAGHDAAILGQIGFSVVAVGLIGWGWRRGGRLAEKGALLLIATPLARLTRIITRWPSRWRGLSCGSMPGMDSAAASKP